jgi:hypothetical protein
LGSGLYIAVINKGCLLFFALARRVGYQKSLPVFFVKKGLLLFIEEFRQSFDVKHPIVIDQIL